MKNENNSLTPSISKPTWRDDFFNISVDCPHGRISDYLSWDQMLSTHKRVFFIVAQTGAGKSTIIEDEVIPWCKLNNLCLLYVSNRKANNLRAKTSLIKKLGYRELFDIYTDRGIEELEVIDEHTQIMSYQKLEHLTRSPLGKLSFTSSVDVVVFDEAHYFCSDSPFNAHTGELLERIPDVFSRAIRIYATATPDEAFPEILKVENRRYFSKKLLSFSESPVCYNFAQDYSYLDIKYFGNIEEIITEVHNGSPTEKWLFFVTSKTIGIQLRDRIGKGAVFLNADKINADSFERQVYLKLIETEKFDNRVLITTPILDNGVNVRDSKLKHIVILSTDKTQFIQALGRKRINQDERFTLYLYTYTADTLSKLLQKLGEQISLVRELKRNPTSTFDRIISGHYKLGFISLKRGRLHINHLAVKKLTRNYDFISEMLEKIKTDKTAFLVEQLSWIDQKESFSHENFLVPVTEPEEAKDVLLAYLEEASKSENLEKKTFFKKFSDLFKAAFPEIKFPKVIGKTTFNRLIRETTIPFSLSASKGELKLTKLP